MKSHLAEALQDASAITISADLLASKGEFEQALVLYGGALAIEPDHAEARRNMALVLGAIGRHDEAIDILTDLVNSTPYGLDERLLLADCLRVVGNFALAADHYRQVLDVDPHAPDALRNFGICQLALGQTSAGRQTLQDVLVRQPDDAEANLHLGLSYYDAEDHGEAIKHLKRAVELSNAPPARASLAESLRQASRLDEAAHTAELLVAQHPDYGHGWHTLGVIELARRNFRTAADACKRALELNPDDGLSVHNLGLCYRCLSEPEAALACFEEAERKLAPASGPTIERATTLLELERHNEAQPILEALSREMPTAAGIWNNLGVSLISLRRLDEALVACKRAIALDPKHPNAHLSLIKCLIDMGHKTEAQQHLRAVLPLCEDSTHNRLMAAGFLETCRLEEEAVEQYREVLRASPDNQRAKARLFDLTLSLCDWQDYDSRTTALIDDIARQTEAGDPISFDVFNLQALPVSYPFIYEAAVNRARSVARDVQEKRSQTPYTHAQPAPGRGKRIRLGYLLPYTNFHSLPLVLKNIVSQHDRDRFEVLGYCTQACQGTEFSISYRNAFDRFTDLPFQQPHAAAATIHDDKIDVLIDVAGLTAVNCMPVVSLRPAPVQAHYLGYSITTGADYIDYLITDRIYIPPEWQAFCSEKLVYMPDTFMATVRQPIADWQPTRAELGLPDRGFVFANFNHPCKFEPIIFKAWMDILRQVPDSVMWFGDWTTATKCNLWREAQNHGIDPDRLRFANIVPHEWHCARLAQADLALDNLHHGGGITTVDALWSGLPVLTMFGDTPPARLGATLVDAAGMPEFIVDDLPAYIETAVALAHEPRRLADLKARLIARRDDCALFDNARHREHLEDGYAAMWANYQAGNPPRPIDLADQASDR